jgi:hypothetical protein
VQHSFEKVFALCDEPAAKILKAVVGTATVDDIRNRPQIPTVRIRQALPQMLVERHDLVWFKLLQPRNKLLCMGVTIRCTTFAFSHKFPKLFNMHQRLP